MSKKRADVTFHGENWYDFVGAKILYWKIEVKPGSPTLAAVKNGKVILGLSGNPL